MGKTGGWEQLLGFSLEIPIANSNITAKKEDTAMGLSPDAVIFSLPGYLQKWLVFGEVCSILTITKCSVYI